MRFLLDFGASVYHYMDYLNFIDDDNATYDRDVDVVDSDENENRAIVVEVLSRRALQQLSWCQTSAQVPLYHPFLASLFMPSKKHTRACMHRQPSMLARVHRHTHTQTYTPFQLAKHYKLLNIYLNKFAYLHRYLHIFRDIQYIYRSSQAPSGCQWEGNIYLMNIHINSPFFKISMFIHNHLVNIQINSPFSKYPYSCMISHLMNIQLHSHYEYSPLEGWTKP